MLVYIQHVHLGHLAISDLRAECLVRLGDALDGLAHLGDEEVADHAAEHDAARSVQVGAVVGVEVELARVRLADGGQVAPALLQQIDPVRVRGLRDRERDRGPVRELVGEHAVFECAPGERGDQDLFARRPSSVAADSGK